MQKSQATLVTSIEGANIQISRRVLAHEAGGGANLLASVTTLGFAVYQCENQGGNQAAGQNKVVTGPATSTTPVSSDAIKNGNLNLTTNPVVLTAATTVSGAAAGCPNSNWTGVDPVLTLTTITLVIEQPVGTVIFRCTAYNANGLTGSVALTC